MSVLQITADGVDAREIDGETVILDTRRSLYLAVNQSGTVLWRRLKQGATRDELVASLTESFDGIDAEVAAADVDAFLALLEEHDLLAR